MKHNEPRACLPKIVCLTCGKKFTPDRPGRMYCSYSCAGKQRFPITCLECSKVFPGYPTAKYCSLACRKIHDNKHVLKKMCMCEFCSKPFLIERWKTREFCSRECSTLAAILPIGTERIHLTNKGQQKEWFVKVEPEDGYRGRPWKRKAVVLLEEMLSRKLSRSECKAIKFIDKDPTNCKVSNLLLESAKGLLVCKTCGKIRRVVSHTFSLKCGEFCNTCCHKKHNTKLNDEQVSLIRSLFNTRKRGGYPNVLMYLSTYAGWFQVSVSVVCKVRLGKTYQEIEPMAKAEVWKALLKQHDVLLKKAGVTLYERVTLLAKVYEDPHYLSAMQKTKKSPIETLDGKVSDTCANFTELLQMLRMFPQKRQWQSGDLSSMRIQMLEKPREQQNGTKKPAKKRKVVTERKGATLAEVRVLDTENERLRNELKTANQIIKALETQLDTTRETIGTLREAIACFNTTKTELQEA